VKQIRSSTTSSLYRIVTPPRRRRCHNGIGEATSHNQTWHRRDVIWEDTVGGDFTVQNMDSRTSLFNVYNISW